MKVTYRLKRWLASHCSMRDPRSRLILKRRALMPAKGKELKGYVWLRRNRNTKRMAWRTRAAASPWDDLLRACGLTQVQR